jgi:hypothetical protein
MARGWESKSVEAQIDMAEQHVRGAALQKPQDARKLNLVRQKESLLLSRTRVLHELDSAQNPRYKAVLTKALADLDAKLSTIVD